MAKGIRALLDTVVQALPQVGNLGLLFFLLFFIFAALGVELFGRLECSEKHPCEGLGKHAHFQNFGIAFLTLFRVATGDNWNGIMKDTLREDCDDSENCVRNCCVNPLIAPVFFILFVLMAQFVLVNVVVAVLMRHLEESHKSMDDDAELEAEIQRELEEEARLKVEQQAVAQREKEDDEDANSDDNPDDEDIIEDADDNLEWGLSLDNWCDVKAYNESFLDEAAKRKVLSKQTSLPPNFCFNVRPPSPDPSCLEGEHYDWRLTPTAIEVALQNELEEREKAASYLDDDYPLTLVVPQLPGHDWPRPEHIPSGSYALPPDPDVTHPATDDFRLRSRVGGLGYLPRQDAVFQGSSGSIASAISEPSSLRGSCAHLTPTSPGVNPQQHLHCSVPHLPPANYLPDGMALRHHSQPMLFYTDQVPGSHYGDAAAAAAIAAVSALVPTPPAVAPPPTAQSPPPPPAAAAPLAPGIEHRYSVQANDYFPTLQPQSMMMHLHSGEEQAMPLTTFSISGDYSEDEDDSGDEGSDQDLLNPSTVFAPREDGPPESYHTDTGPRQEDTDEGGGGGGGTGVMKPPAGVCHDGPNSAEKPAGNPAADHDDIEVKNISIDHSSSQPAAATPLAAAAATATQLAASVAIPSTAVPTPPLSGKPCCRLNDTGELEGSLPNKEAASGKSTNCSQAKLEEAANTLNNYNTHASCDGQRTGDGANDSQTVPRDTASSPPPAPPTTQHPTSPVSTSPITLNFAPSPTPLAAIATHSPPPYGDIRLYPSESPTISQSQAPVATPHHHHHQQHNHHHQQHHHHHHNHQGAGEMDTELASVSDAGEPTLPSTGNPGDGNTQPQSITALSGASVVVVGGGGGGVHHHHHHHHHESPDAVIGPAVDTNTNIDIDIDIDIDTDTGPVDDARPAGVTVTDKESSAATGTVSPPSPPPPPPSKPENNRRQRPNEADETIARGAEEYV